jgi:single-strand DNA-binding protein
MASYNRVIMMGNLTRDPEYKQLSSGQAVCRLGIASNRQFKNKTTGLLTQEVCFIDIDVWGAQADSCNQYLQKGRLVLVEGRLKLDSWEDDSGQRRSKHSIVADRVTFLSMQSQEEASEGKVSEEIKPAVAPIPEVKKEVKPAVASEPKKAPESNVAPSGEVNFTDQKPFEDDLPF